MDLAWYFRGQDSSRDALPVIVFDGDDTLWTTEALYDEARWRSAEIVADAGLDASRFEQLQRDIDVRNFDRYGLSRQRFPTSSKEAYLVLAADSGCSASEKTAQAVYDASAEVFEVPAPLAPHAEATLRRLSGRYRLAVLTKGDPVVQRRRIDESALAPWLDAACVVEVKDAAVFTSILREINCPPEVAWSVGNSYGSDIYPAVRAGMRAVWIDAAVWAHERSLSEQVQAKSDPNVFVAKDLGELPAILDCAPTTVAST